MSAKFNVFSQTVQQLTAAPQVGWKMMPLLLAVVGPKWPLSKSVWAVDYVSILVKRCSGLSRR
jgi:hypothetical protein